MYVYMYIYIYMFSASYLSLVHFVMYFPLRNMYFCTSWAKAAPATNIFGGEPNLMGGLAPLAAPLTVAAPTTMYPSLAAPMTAAYPAASYQLPVQQGYAQAGSAYMTGSQFGGSMALTGGAMTTQMPAYGAYGAQAAPQMVSTSLNQAVYPTGSMRIG